MNMSYSVKAMIQASKRIEAREDRRGGMFHLVAALASCKKSAKHSLEVSG